MLPGHPLAEKRKPRRREEKAETNASLPAAGADSPQTDLRVEALALRSLPPPPPRRRCPPPPPGAALPRLTRPAARVLARGRLAPAAAGLVNKPAQRFRRGRAIRGPAQGR